MIARLSFGGVSVFEIGLIVAAILGIWIAIKIARVAIRLLAFMAGLLLILFVIYFVLVR